MDTIDISWRRLIDDHHKSCSYCVRSQASLAEGTRLLVQCLKPLGLDVTFTHVAISPEQLRREPHTSNCILVDGRPLETWLNGIRCQEQLCEKCGDNKGGRLQIDGVMHKGVTVDQVVRAGLLAAAERLRTLAAQT